jgi:hypothetical protein
VKKETKKKQAARTAQILQLERNLRFALSARKENWGGSEMSK